jgi:hypothetical protein
VVLLAPGQHCANAGPNWASVNDEITCSKAATALGWSDLPLNSGASLAEGFRPKVDLGGCTRSDNDGLQFHELWTGETLAVGNNLLQRQFCECVAEPCSIAAECVPREGTATGVGADDNSVYAFCSALTDEEVPDTQGTCFADAADYGANAVGSDGQPCGYAPIVGVIADRAQAALLYTGIEAVVDETLTSALDCQARCASTEGCDFFTYEEDTLHSRCETDGEDASSLDGVCADDSDASFTFRACYLKSAYTEDRCGAGGGGSDPSQTCPTEATACQNSPNCAALIAEDEVDSTECAADVLAAMVVAHHLMCRGV